MSLQDERNARLDSLLAASTAWTNKRVKELEDKVALVKKIMKSRTGSERLVAKSNQLANEVVVDSIEQFLGG